MAASEAENETDDELLYLNRRKTVKKRRGKGVLGNVQRIVGNGLGTKEMPVLLDLVDDNGPAAGGPGTCQETEQKLSEVAVYSED